MGDEYVHYAKKSSRIWTEKLKKNLCKTSCIITIIMSDDRKDV